MSTRQRKQQIRFSRISLKLSMVLVAGGFFIFGAYGVYELHIERNALLRKVEQETMLLGRSLQAAVENALRDRQVADIEETIRYLERADPSITILIYDQAGRSINAVRGSQPLDPRLQRARETAMQLGQEVFTFHSIGDVEQAILALPLSDDHRALLGGMLLVRPLHDLQRAQRDLQRTILITVMVFVVTTTVLGLIAGITYINLPLGRMAEAMKEVRAGNLMSALPDDRRDEISAVAAEFNAMVADLRDARRRLEEEAESRRRLQRALQDADKLITIGQLSAGLAHEIGSPLQVLRGRARTLLTRAHAAGEVQRIAEILVAQTDRITRIVEKLLRLTRRRPAQIARSDVRSAIDNVLELMQYEAHRCGVTLAFSGTAHLPPMWVDTDEIQQILLNLIANALAATPKGGKVLVSIENSQLTPRNGGCETPAVRLVVEDTGSGIAADVRERVFEPFFTTRATEGGTGLGLAVVKSLVTDHGGVITVESEPGLGSRFCVELPVYKPTAQQEAS
ncbi:MAG: ATP-binding protein [Candidatus Binatia bacterium]